MISNREIALLQQEYEAMQEQIDREWNNDLHVIQLKNELPTKGLCTWGGVINSYHGISLPFDTKLWKSVHDVKNHLS